MAEKTKLRMMVVDDSSETREYLSKLLQFEGYIDLVGSADNGSDAVKMAVELKPDLILMDINMPVMDGISAAEAIFRQVPGVRVVMMSVQSEMAYLRRAMQAGAREFLIKPFTHDQLLKILQQVSSLAVTPREKAPRAPVAEAVFPQLPTEKQGTLVAVFSPRGGAGCSTLAVNLSIALQGQRKANVLAIDGNLRFGALDAILNIQGSRSITDLLQSLDDGDPELLHINALPHSSGIRILAAPPSPEMADLVTVKHLAQVVALSRMRYDYVVADVASGLDERALFFLDAADCIFALLTPDIPAIKNTRSFLELAHRLRYPPEKIHLVLNRVDPRGGLNANAIQRHLKLPIVASIPDIPRVAQAAINRGVPLILYERTVYKEMPVTRQVLAMADMVPEPGLGVLKAQEIGPEIRVPVITSLPKTAPQPKKRGLLDRFLGRR